MRRFFQLLLGLLFLSSCSSTSYTTYESLFPAKVNIPKDVKTISFLHRNIEFPSDTITWLYSHNEKVYKDTTDYTNIATAMAYFGLSESLETHYPLDTIPLVKIDKQRLPDDPKISRTIPPLDWTTVDSICAANGSDILISLEDLMIFNNYETWSEGYLLYNGVCEITAWDRWRIYDPLHKKILDSHSKIDTLEVFESASNLRELKEKKLPRRTQIMPDVAYQIGKNYAQDLVPQWKKVHRYYYVSGDKNMQTAHSLATRNNWEEAVKLWHTASKEGKNDLLKARASFNMAVGYERLQELELAKTALLQSQLLYIKSGKNQEEKRTTENYLKIIQKRIKDFSLLDEQLSEEQ